MGKYSGEISDFSRSYITGRAAWPCFFQDHITGHGMKARGTYYMGFIFTNSSTKSGHLYVMFDRQIATKLLYRKNQ